MDLGLVKSRAWAGDRQYLSGGKLTFVHVDVGLGRHVQFSALNGWRRHRQVRVKADAEWNGDVVAIGHGGSSP